MKELIKKVIEEKMKGSSIFDFIVRQGAIIYQKMVQENDERELADQLLEVGENIIEEIKDEVFGKFEDDDSLEEAAVDFIIALLKEVPEWAKFNL